MRLPVGSRNLAGLYQGLEVTQIFDHRLFGIAADDGLPHACQFAHSEHLQYGDERAAVSGSRFENNLARVFGFASHRSPCDPLSRFIGQNFRVPFDRLVARPHDPVGRFLTRHTDAFDLLLPKGSRLNIAPRAVEILATSMDQTARSHPNL